MTIEFYHERPAANQASQMAGYLSQSRSDLAEILSAPFEYDFEIFGIENLPIAPTSVQFDPNDGSGVQSLSAPYTFSHSYAKGRFAPTYLVTFPDGSVIRQSFRYIDLIIPTQVFLFEGGNYSIVLPSLAFTHLKIVGVAGGGGGGNGAYEHFSSGARSGGAGGGGGAAFELTLQYLQTMQGLTVTGFAGRGGANGASGQATTVEAFDAVSKITADGGKLGGAGSFLPGNPTSNLTSLPEPQGGEGGQVLESPTGTITYPGGRGGNGGYIKPLPAQDGQSTGGTGGGGGGSYNIQSTPKYAPSQAKGANGNGLNKEPDEVAPLVLGSGGDGGSWEGFTAAKSGSNYGGGGGGGIAGDATTGLSRRGGSGRNGYVIFILYDDPDAPPGN